jgi:Dockerin type I domain
VILDNVTDGVNVGTVVIPMAVLLGDVNGDGFVLSGDYTAVRQKSGSAVDGNTFKFDINADGFILSGDYTTARQQSGAHLSPTKVGPIGKTSIKKLVTTIAERAKHY